MRLQTLAQLGIVAALTAVLSASTTIARRPSPTVAPPKITVFKDPNCGCCRSWVEHLRQHGFSVAVRDTSDVSGAKRAGRVPENLHSCHTAFVGGYVIEGHVPAADIQRLLRDKPKIAGLAVPGMPAGSPGMEVGNRVDKYDVIAFQRDGSTRVFAHH